MRGAGLEQRRFLGRETIRSAGLRFLLLRFTHLSWVRGVRWFLVLVFGMGIRGGLFGWMVDGDGGMGGWGDVLPGSEGKSFSGQR